MDQLKQSPIILAIETSCDETAVSVLSGTQVLANEVYSQMDLHAQYGGVVPLIAKLAHIEKFDSVLNGALNRAGVTLEGLDAVAVTVGPGLAIALEVGVTKAKEIAQNHHKPLLAMNHMEGHLLSSFANMPDLSEINFPALGVLVSGGHTEFLLVEKFGSYQKIGQTLDDACGEAFDKCAHLLGLAYPGGPIVSKLASAARERLDIKQVRDNATLFVQVVDTETQAVYRLPIPMANTNDLNVSFSGLKTAVKQLITSHKTESADLALRDQENIAATFETAAFAMINLKLEKALQAHQVKEIWVGGGVIANKYFREELGKIALKFGLELRIPEAEFTTDNAAMIGVAAAINLQNLGLHSAEEIAQTPEESLVQHGIFLARSDLKAVDRQPNLSL